MSRFCACQHVSRFPEFFGGRFSLACAPRRRIPWRSIAETINSRCGQRKGDSKSRALARARTRPTDAAAVRFDRRLGDCQTQPKSAELVRDRFVRLNEGFEDSFGG